VQTTRVEYTPLNVDKEDGETSAEDSECSSCPSSGWTDYNAASVKSIMRTDSIKITMFVTFYAYNMVYATIF
jgi:hypothetical protein